LKLGQTLSTINFEVVTNEDAFFLFCFVFRAFLLVGYKFYNTVYRVSEIFNESGKDARLKYVSSMSVHI
jgi:hypothetical protein